MSWIRSLDEVGAGDIAEVGGKNASLGEMLRKLPEMGVRVPNGFAVTAKAYRAFLEANGLEEPIQEILRDLCCEDVEKLAATGEKIRNLILEGTMPEEMQNAIRFAYRDLSKETDERNLKVAVRSSATAEDLPTASFAGQQETYLYVHGEADVIRKVKRCFASLFTDRAISYRERNGFDHFSVSLSVGVQRMIAADGASSGVMFTLEPDSGFPDVVYVTSIWGLGENIVQGRVGPDEFYVHKPTLRQGFDSIIQRKRGPKEFKLVYDRDALRLENIPVPDHQRRQLSLSDEEVLQLARWAVAIEDHYSRENGRPTPMDIEWAKDSHTGELFIVQARPETVQSQKQGATIKNYKLRETGKALIVGLGVGEAIASGKARVILDPRDMKVFQPGEILITEITDPDWEPVLKKAAAVVTERGGRTSHAAIVAREMGIPAVVGANGACRAVQTEQPITVSCAGGEAGTVYEGELPFDVEEIDPSTLARPRTKIMLNVADPEIAFHAAQFPNSGVGLARMEFIFAGWVKVHPLALTRYETLAEHVKKEVDELVNGSPSREEYLIDRLSQGIGMLAAAFWPNPVILRFSDFKTNEYAGLLGGRQFEPEEENPMLGWRGASRYYHPEYKEGFLLEVAAVKRVREQFGLTNLKVMIPFCRTPEEGRRVLDTMAEGGLVQGENGLEVICMAEIPANVLLADEFAELFDGFSIGSNDLTQLVLGVDRDSDRVISLFDERNAAVKRACALLIQAAHEKGVPVGICGQAPSDYPEFAAFLVEQGIDSISLVPDAVMRTSQSVLEAEQSLARSGGQAANPIGGNAAKAG